jgi:hypothetical protein
MSVSIYLINDYKKQMCYNMFIKIRTVCYSLKYSDKDNCDKLLDDYKKFCIPHK